jgi:hypothetical protein
VPGPAGPQGAAGTPGEVWFTGSGVPAGAIGIVGDWYLNSANGDYYEKTASAAWTLRGNLRGPQGIQGPAGADSTVPGPPGPQGEQGIQGVPGPSAITTRGDLAVGDATGAPVRLPIGAAGHVLTSQAGTDPAWAAPAPSGAPVDATYVTTTANATLTAEMVLAAGTGLSLSGATFSLADNGVTNGKLADMATARLKGRVTTGTGDPEDLTGTQATTLLDVFTSTLKGVAPSSGGGTTNFLRADGTWSAPPAGMANPMTAVGDVIKGGTAGAPERLAIGGNGQVLTVASGAPAWQTPAAPGMANPMTAQGDLITGSAAGAPTRLPISANAYTMLRSNGTTAAWSSFPQLQALKLGNIPVPYLDFVPTAGNEWWIEAGVTADQFRIRNVTDGTTPLAITSYSVALGTRHLEVSSFPGANIALLRLSPPGGHRYDIYALGTGQADINAFKISNLTDGTTPLAILSDRVQISGRYFEVTTYAGGARVRFAHTGAHVWDIIAYAGYLEIADITVPRALARFYEDGEIYLNISGLGLWRLGLNAVDSATPGWRQVMVPNNPA